MRWSSGGDAGRRRSRDRSHASRMEARGDRQCGPGPTRDRSMGRSLGVPRAPSTTASRTVPAIAFPIPRDRESNAGRLRRALHHSTSCRTRRCRVSLPGAASRRRAPETVPIASARVGAPNAVSAPSWRAQKMDAAHIAAPVRWGHVGLPDTVDVRGLWVDDAVPVPVPTPRPALSSSGAS